jgi:ribosomal protein L16 Arg81 hydroxylase
MPVDYSISHDVSRFLMPLGLDRFLSEVWGRTHLYLRGAEGQYEDLLPWTDFNRILEEHQLDFPRVRLVKAGRTVPPTEYRGYQQNKRGAVHSYLMAERVNRELRHGATLIVDSIDEAFRPLREVSNLFADAFRTSVRMNAYFSAGDEAGFPPHWDDHEVIVLQIHGRKRWKVFGTGMRFPIREGAPGDTRPPDQILWEGVLRAGDLLYLPRGCWHVALPESTPTLHLSVGFHNKTGLDFIEWLVGRLRESESLRMDLPVLAGRDAQRAHAETLLAEIAQRWRPELLATFIDETRAAAAVRRSFDLPGAAAAADPVHAADAARARGTPCP